MDILAHDENSLTNLLFSEMHRHEKLPAFLGRIQWRGGARFPIDARSATLHQQLNLSEFGKPDAFIIILDTAGHYHVVIVESKLATYIESCGANLEGRRFNKDNNSELNNQLTLRYRAMRSLRTLHTPPGYLTEGDHVAQSPYSVDVPRRCHKLATRRLLRTLPPDATTFYLVALTADASPVFDTVDPAHQFFPLFFNQATQQMEDEFPSLGSISWHCCNGLFSGIENHFTPSYRGLFHPPPVQAGNPLEAQAAAGEISKRHIVEYGSKICYLSRGEPGSYRLHGWTAQGFELLQKATRDVALYEALLPHLHPICQAPRIEREGHDDEWRRFFEEELPRRRSESRGGA